REQLLPVDRGNRSRQRTRRRHHDVSRYLPGSQQHASGSRCAHEQQHGELPAPPGRGKSRSPHIFASHPSSPAGTISSQSPHPASPNATRCRDPRIHRTSSGAPPQLKPLAYYLAVTYARDERLELCALLDRTGPDAPTLCAGWRTADLAAHLVLREHRPDAAAGVMGGPLARHTAQTQRKLSKRTPYPKLVEMIRTGPPRFSFFGIPGVDAKANFAEYFVHHEDVRRGQPDWQPRNSAMT